MKVRSDIQKGAVVVELTPKEAMSIANRLVRCAIQSAPSTDLTKEPAEEDPGQEPG